MMFYDYINQSSCFSSCNMFLFMTFYQCFFIMFLNKCIEKISIIYYVLSHSISWWMHWENLYHLRDDALKYWKWSSYCNCTIHEHQQKMQIYIETLNDSNYNIYLFMKVIITLFNDDLSNLMLLIQYKRIRVLFYIELVSFIHSSMF